MDGTNGYYYHGIQLDVIAVLCVAVGLLYRARDSVLFVHCDYLFLINEIHFHGHHYLLCAVLFWMILVNLNHRERLIAGWNRSRFLQRLRSATGFCLDNAFQGIHCLVRSSRFGVLVVKDWISPRRPGQPMVKYNDNNAKRAEGGAGSGVLTRTAQFIMERDI